MDQIVSWIEGAPLWAVWLLFGLLALLFARKSQVDEWVEAHPRIGGVLKTMRGIGLDPWIIAQGITLILFGRLPEKPKLGIKPKLPQGIGPIALALLCGSLVATPALLAACSATPTAKAQMVEAGEALAFNGAAVSLALLDAEEARFLDSLQKPTEAQVAKAEKCVERLQFARDVLAQVRELIEGQGTGDAIALTRQAAQALREVLAMLKSEGVKVPPEAQQALEFGGLL